jgi:hypothetical protein
MLSLSKHGVGFFSNLLRSQEPRLQCVPDC